MITAAVELIPEDHAKHFTLDKYYKTLNFLRGIPISTSTVHFMNGLRLTAKLLRPPQWRMQVQIRSYSLQNFFEKLQDQNQRNHIQAILKTKTEAEAEAVRQVRNEIWDVLSGGKTGCSHFLPLVRH
jgi:hypothetical protein